MEPLAFALALLLGLAAGVASGLFGIGGGILVVPGLLLLLPGTTFFDAKAVSLAAMALGGVVGMLRHRAKRSVDLRLGLALGAGGVVATAVSVVLVERVAEATLQGAFGAFLVLTGARLWFPVMPKHAIQDAKHALPFAFGTGAVAGLLGGAFGIGGGVLVVPALVFAGLGMHLAVGTSLVSVLVIGAAATATHAALGYGPVLVALGVPVALGALVGARFGADLAQKLDADPLRKAFGVFLVLVGAYLAADAFLV